MSNYRSSVYVDNQTTTVSQFSEFWTCLRCVFKSGSPAPSSSPLLPRKPPPPQHTSAKLRWTPNAIQEGAPPPCAWRTVSILLIESVRPTSTISWTIRRQASRKFLRTAPTAAAPETCGMEYLNSIDCLPTGSCHDFEWCVCNGNQIMEI